MSASSYSISRADLLDANALARGLSIWTVVACHIALTHAFWKPVSMFASAGKLAVSIFLFLSGLLLQVQVNRTDGILEVSTWLKKRFFRIYPVYWAGLALTLFCARIFCGRTYGAGTIAANVLGIPIWTRQIVVSCGYASPFWFISLLLFCYVLFLFVHRIRHKGFLALVALALSFIALRTGGFMGAAAYAFPSFFMGMAMADRLRQRGETPSDARCHAAAFFPLLGLLAFVFKGHNFIHLDARYDVWLDLLGCAGLTIIPWPALHLVAYVQKLLARGAPSALRGLLWVSGLSFAVYCVHEPLLVVVAKSSAAGHPWSGLLVYVLLVLGAGWGLDAMDRMIRGGQK